VAELASEWGVTPTPRGKTIWAVVRAADATADIEDADVASLLARFSDVGDGDSSDSPRVALLERVAA
jgi:hypothetical protein